MWDFLLLLVVGIAILGIVAVVVGLIALIKWLWEAIVELCGSLIDVLQQSVTFAGDALVLDTLGHRQRVAEELDRSAENVKESGDAESLRKLERAALSPDSFKRSYALDALGRLGKRASEALTLQVRGLASRDPFVREAAAHALYRGGSQGPQARAALVEVLRKRRSEGTARYAVLALGQIEGLTAEDLKVLEATALAVDSYAAEEAADLFKRLTGGRPAQI